MKSIRFKNTHLFSPVANKLDLPWPEDYFHLGFNAFTSDVLKSDDYIIDREWWITQYNRCINGYTVQDAIEYEGDCFTDELQYYTDEKTNETYSWGNNIEVHENGDVYFKELQIWVRDKAVTITGRHYFYLNFWSIKRIPEGGGTKTVGPPRFTDLSFENWWIRDLARQTLFDILWAKARQKGMSEEEAADTAYDFIFKPDSQTVIIGGEDFYNNNTMLMVKRGLQRLTHTQLYKELRKGGDNQYYLAAKKVGSEVYSRTCKDNPEAASGLSPSKAHLEEIGIFAKGLLKQVNDTLDASLEAEGIDAGAKTGIRVYTGTGGDMENGVADMEEMFYNPNKFNILPFDNVYESNDGDKIGRFIPAFKFKVVDQQGNSKALESIKYILSSIEKADVSRRYTLSVMNPLKPSQIYRTKTGGYFGSAITQYCNERIASIRNHRELQTVKKYRGEWVDPVNPYKGVNMIPDENGMFMIDEMPKANESGVIYENLYRGGTDSYDRDEASYSTSKGACWIKKGFLNANQSYNTYVAGIIERPTESEGGREKFYEHTAMLCVFYNAINLIEYSNTLIIDWYVRKGFSTYLKLRPEFVTANMVIHSKMNNKYGIDPSTKSQWLAMQATYLTKDNIDKCNFVILLEAWAKFRYDPQGKKYNCDNTIAASLCTVCEEDEKEFVVHTEKKKENKPLRYIKDMNGNLILQ